MVKLPVVALVLLYTSYQSLLYEIFTVPIISAFLEICPPNLESFFMGMFFFINNASKNVGNVLGSFLTWYLDIKSENFDRLRILIFINFGVVFIGYMVLLKSFVPNNRIEPIRYRDKLDDIEMQHIASIVAGYEGKISYIDIAEDYINEIYNEGSK